MSEKAQSSISTGQNPKIITPNKEFKNVNLTNPHDFGVKVKGSKGKKNYIQETKRYHQAHKKMGLIKD